MPESRLARTRQAYDPPSPALKMCTTCGTLNRPDDAICVKCLDTLYGQER